MSYKLLAWMPVYQIPGGFLPNRLAVATQFTTLVEHPTEITTYVAIWATTHQLLPPSLP